MEQVDLKEAIDRAVYNIRNKQQPDHLYFFTGGTGLPDDVCVEYFKETKSVIVVTRDNKQYCAGKLLEESNGDRSI